MFRNEKKSLVTLKMSIVILSFVPCVTYAEGTSHPTTSKSQHASTDVNARLTKAIISAFTTKLDDQDKEAKDKARGEIVESQTEIADLQKKYGRCTADLCLQTSGGMWFDTEEWRKYQNRTVDSPSTTPTPFLSLNQCQPYANLRCKAILDERDGLEAGIKERNETLDEDLMSNGLVYYVVSAQNYEGNIFAVIAGRIKGSNDIYLWSAYLHRSGDSLIVDSLQCNDACRSLPNQYPSAAWAPK